jgi:hypothetical protein
MNLSNHIKHLAKKEINTLVRGTQNNTQSYHGSPPPWGYIHNIFFFIISVKQLQHRDSTILTSHKTKYLRCSLDPSSLHFSTKQLASFLQSCTDHLKDTSDHTDPVPGTKTSTIHHIDVLLSPYIA